MTTLLTPQLAITYIVLFAVVMVAGTWFFGRRAYDQSIDGFLVADRDIPW